MTKLNAVANVQVTDWQSYTPTFGAGFGTVTFPQFFWRRVGDTIHIWGRFNNGTTAASTASVSIPSGLTIDTAKLSTNERVIGEWKRFVSGLTSIKTGTVFIAVTPTVGAELSFGFDDYDVNANPASPQNGSTLFGTGDTVELHASFPIVGWSSNLVTGERAVEEYASNNSSWNSTDAAGTNSVAGPAGSVISGNLTAARTKTVIFQTAIQPTDSFVLEFQWSGVGPWLPVGSLDTSAEPTTFFEKQLTNSYGASVRRTTGNAVSVTFGRYGAPATGAYGAAGFEWGSFDANSRWRVRKISGGAAVGYPIDRTNLTYAGAGNGMFYEEGSFTGTLTGCTTSPTATVNYVRIGKSVLLSCGGVLGVSNSVSASITGMPASIRPSFQTNHIVRMVDNGTAYAALLEITTLGVINLYPTAGGGNFTASGSKGVAAFGVSYQMP